MGEESRPEEFERSIAALVCASPRLVRQTTRFVALDDVEVAYWQTQTTAPAWVLVCLHSRLDPRAYANPSVGDSSPQKRPWRYSAMVEVMAHSTGLQREAPPVAFERNRGRTRAAIVAGELRTVGAAPLDEPLNADVSGKEFRRWVDVVGMRPAGPWSQRRDGAIQEDLEIADALHGHLQLVPCANAMHLYTCSVAREFWDRFQAAEDTPSEREIATFLRASGAAVSGAMVNAILRYLRSDAWARGRKRQQGRQRPE